MVKSHQFISQPAASSFLSATFHHVCPLVMWFWQHTRSWYLCIFLYCCLLGTFVKLLNVTISFIMSVHPSVGVKQLGSHWMDFHENWYLSIFWKTVKKIQVSLKSDKNYQYFTWRPLEIFYHMSLKFFLKWQMFQKKVVEEIKTYILCSITPPPLNCDAYEILWKNILEWGRPQMKIWCMCIACWIPKATNTRSQYVILVAFPPQQWLHNCSSILCYIYIAYLVICWNGYEL